MSEAQLRKRVQEYASEALVNFMSGISEYYYCAGWLTGLEFILWGMAYHGHDREFGMGEVSNDEIEHLKQLSEDADGWWRWDNEDGNRFVTLDEWRAIYAKKVGQL